MWIGMFGRKIEDRIRVKKGDIEKLLEAFTVKSIRKSEFLGEEPFPLCNEYGCHQCILKRRCSGVSGEMFNEIVDACSDIFYVHSGQTFDVDAVRVLKNFRRRLRRALNSPNRHRKYN